MAMAEAAAEAKRSWGVLAPTGHELGLAPRAVATVDPAKAAAQVGRTNSSWS